MLYATTRNAQEAYTAQRALSESLAPDGGFYVPYREPYFYGSQLKAFQDKSFLEVTAEILNLLFNSRLTAWDLEFAGGRHPMGLNKIGRRTMAGERWRNTAFTFRGFAEDMGRSLSCQEVPTLGPWGQIGVSIATLFAAVSQLQKVDILKPGCSLDVAVEAGNLYSAVSCIYGKNWGLPIGTVVCGCRESEGLFTLLHRGVLRTDTLNETQAQGLELLLNAVGGPGECRRFLYALDLKKTYLPSDPVLQKLRESLSASVISDRRVEDILPGAYRTHGCLLSLDGAAAYAALQDHRAVTGSGNWGMVLSDRGPGLDSAAIAGALHMEEKELKKLLTNF